MDANASAYPSEKLGQNGEKNDENEITMSRLESMVTPEQVLSANVARKRRNVAKKRSASAYRVRDATPGREECSMDSSSSQDVVRPKTPERPRRRLNRSASDRVKRRDGNETKKSWRETSTERESVSVEEGGVYDRNNRSFRKGSRTSTETDNMFDKKLVPEKIENLKVAKHKNENQHSINRTNQTSPSETEISDKNIQRSKDTLRPEKRSSSKSVERNLSDAKENKSNERKYSDPFTRKSSDPNERKSTDSIQIKFSDPIERKSNDPIERKSSDPLKRKSSDPIDRKSTNSFERKSSDSFDRKPSNVLNRKLSDPFERKPNDPLQRKPNGQEISDSVQRGLIVPSSKSKPIRFMSKSVERKASKSVERTQFLNGSKPQYPDDKKESTSIDTSTTGTDYSGSLRVRKVPKSNIFDKTVNRLIDRAGSVPKDYGSKPDDNKDGKFKSKMSTLTSITPDDIKTFFQKARSSITPTKKKKEATRRAQSTPNQLTEEEFLKSLKETQAEEKLPPKRKPRASRRYSSTSDEEIKPQRRKYKPEAKEIVNKKNKQRMRSLEKIVQVIDPKTSKIVSTKCVSNIKFSFWQFLKVLRYLSMKDIFREYKEIKIDMKTECEAIRKLRNKCFCQLSLMMIFCGIGGMIFKTTEGAFENFYKCGVKRVKRDFLDTLWVRSHNMREEDWKSLARSKLRIFEEELHTAHEAGMHSYSGQRSWSFLNGIVYSLTVVTTIGEGNF